MAQQTLKFYTEEQVRKAMQDARYVSVLKPTYDEILESLTPIELPTDEKIEEIAQWVIDNRYPKNELNKISDFEMYHHIIKLIKEQILNQNK